MIHGRFRIIVGAGLPGDPGGGGDGGGGDVPPNPPIDPTTRGPDDPGGGGGPITGSPGGAVDRCSILHTVKFDRDSGDPTEGNVDADPFFGRLWLLTFDGVSAWSANDGNGHSVTMGSSGDGAFRVIPAVSGIGNWASFRGGTGNKCPGQSLYGWEQNYLGLDWSGVRCFVG